MNHIFDKENGIIIRQFSGKVVVETVIASWVEIFNLLKDDTSIKGILSDFSQADFQLDPPDLKTLMQYLRSNYDFFRNVRLAVVIDNPKVAIPMIASTEYPEFKIQAFSTSKAAMEWLIAKI